MRFGHALIVVAALANVVGCGDDWTDGTSKLGATFNYCPVVSFAAASLASSASGGGLNVSAAATDADPRDKLTFRWSATMGSFQDDRAANTLYVCAAPGQQTLTVEVSDGKCSTTGTIDVTCVPTV